MKAVCAEFADGWCFQLEKCPTNGKLHYQARWKLEKKEYGATLLQVLSCRGFAKDDLDLSPESNNSVQQGGLSFYVMKDDTREAGPWHDASYKPKKRKVYEGRDLKCMENPFEWQADVIQRISVADDDRSINWVYNRLGNAGKSKLMKYLCFKGDGVTRVPLGTATQIKTCVIEKGEHNAFMVDLPRVRGSDERQQELFSAIEEIKNGWVESPMYGKKAELFMEPPHVWVFSNELPTISNSSVDRWKVWTIADNQLHAMTWLDISNERAKFPKKKDDDP